MYISTKLKDPKGHVVKESLSLIPIPWSLLSLTGYNHCYSSCVSFEEHSRPTLINMHILFFLSKVVGQFCTFAFFH